MILLDTNIIVYSLSKNSIKKVTAQNFIQQNLEDLVVAHQNINETLRVITHPKYPKPLSIDAALGATVKIAEGISIIFPKEDTIFVALELLKKYKVKSNHIFDIYLVATMLTNGIEKIATDNVKDFAIFKEISVVNPF